VKFSISHRIFLLVLATTCLVGGPLLFISEEMYQEHTTVVADEISTTLVQQILHSLEKEQNGPHLGARSSSTRLIFIFNASGSILEGDTSEDAGTILKALLPKVKQHAGPAPFFSTEVLFMKEDEPKGWDCVAGVSPQTGLFVAVAHDRDYTHDARISMQLTAGAFALGVLMLGMVGAQWVSGRITRPLKLLGDYARALPSRDFDSENGQGVLSELQCIRDRDVNELVQAFFYMEKELARHIREQRETAAERERIRSELRIAAEIQQGALPGLMRIPGDKLSISAHMLPAREVGGDLYDYFMQDDDTLLFTLGDVSGKGVPAALFMFAAQHMLRSLGQQRKPLTQLLAKLNDNLAENNTSAMYVTLFAARYEVGTGRLEYALAGHQAPFLKKADGTLEKLEAPANLPLGNLDDVAFESRTITIQPGESVVAFTDGVTEACDKDGKRYGLERLETLLAGQKILSCSTMLENVLASVGAFSQSCEMRDDVTVLCFQRKDVSGGQRG